MVFGWDMVFARNYTRGDNPDSIQVSDVNKTTMIRASSGEF